MMLRVQTPIHGPEPRQDAAQRENNNVPTSPHHPHQKPLEVRQNASNHMPPLRPAAPVLMRLRPRRKFESKEPYIAGRCGGGTTARAGPKWAFFVIFSRHGRQGRKKAALWAACGVAGVGRRSRVVFGRPCALSRRGGHPGRPARVFAASSFS